MTDEQVSQEIAWTVAETARRTMTSERQVRRWMAAGLPFIRPSPGKVLILVRDLNAWFEAHREKRDEVTA